MCSSEVTLFNRFFTLQWWEICPGTSNQIEFIYYYYYYSEFNEIDLNIVDYKLLERAGSGLDRSSPNPF